MIDEIKSLKNEIEEKLAGIKKSNVLEQFRLEYLVKKGKLQALFDKMKTLPNDQKPVVGKELNILRKTVEAKFNELQEKFKSEHESTPEIDLTLPGRRNYKGTFHPIKQIMQKMTKFFIDFGFDVAEGPEIEDDYHNFDALNFPPNHPARDMQDTFFIKQSEDLLLRTHTSPVQIRMMEGKKPPIRAIMPGRVFRNEAINARSLAEFHQIEGLYIDKKVTLSELRGTMMAFARAMYGNDIKFRFRPSFFPFTEPSAEMDVSCYLCGGKGCRVCKHTGWLEIVGCGMVHPNVLKSGGVDPEEYTGYAFGFGIERVALLSLGMNDIRNFYENDIRILQQF